MMRLASGRYAKAAGWGALGLAAVLTACGGNVKDEKGAGGAGGGGGATTTKGGDGGADGTTTTGTGTGTTGTTTGTGTTGTTTGTGNPDACVSVCEAQKQLGCKDAPDEPCGPFCEQIFDTFGPCTPLLDAVFTCWSANMAGGCTDGPPDACEAQLEALEVCMDESGCGDGSCFGSSEGDCGCTSSCDGETLESSCAPGPNGAMSCECFVNGASVGTCTGDGDLDACDLATGCCAAFF